MLMETSDTDLVNRANAGDGDAFATLLARHYDRIFGFAFRLTGSRSEAEDLTQDICAALPNKLRHFQGRARFSTWLYRVVLNASHDRRRKQATQKQASDQWGDWEKSRTAAIAEDAERIDWLTQAMRALSDDLRDTLALILDDRTHAQAAEILGVSEGTVSWRMSEAKKRLKDMKAQEDHT